MNPYPNSLICFDPDQISGLFWTAVLLDHTFHPQTNTVFEQYNQTNIQGAIEAVSMTGKGVGVYQKRGTE
jgi:hypothetical protein